MEQTAKPPCDAASFRRILVIKPSSLGDILHVFPALSLLRGKCPESQLDFVVNPELEPLLDLSPFPVSHRILFQRRKLGKLASLPSELWKLCGELRREKYDIAIDFQGLMRSAFCAWASGAKIIAGPAAPREKTARIFYNLPVKTVAIQAIERNIEIVNQIFGETSAAPRSVPTIAERDLPFAIPRKRYITVLPGARWASKTFPPELFSEVMRLVLCSHGDVGFVIAGTSGDGAAAAAIRTALPQNFPLVDATGRTDIPQLASLLAHSAAVLSNDSGPLHLAAYLKTPTFSFYGPTDPLRTGPWYPEAKVYTVDALPCLCCLKRTCPGGTNACHRIGAAIVAADISAALELETT
ncbi:MAG: glycosyltransferase family 9 protein [Victivallaceae bacterium]|nr:glycosyltransferase family 9 protein [Victivallaceae bacterium]